MIKAQIIGHLGKDAIIKEVNGRTVINFSVAHTESYKNAEGVKMERTLWVECAHWTEKTAVAQYLKKGTQVYVEGQPSVDSYLNNENKSVATLRIRVGQIQLLGSSNRTQEQTTSNPSPAPVATSFTDGMSADDDLPF